MRAWWSLVYGIRNLRRWLPIIWRDRDFDWEFLAIIMESKLRWMAEGTINWHVKGATRQRKHMLICAELLRRLRDEDYFENAERRFGSCGIAGKFATAQGKADKAYLGLIIGKYLNHWWD